MVSRMSLEKVEFKVPGELGPTFSIEKLYNVEVQDVENWCKRFKRVMFNCQYTAETSMRYLIMCVDEKYQELIEDEKEISVAFQKLMRLTYNKEKFYKILRE